MKIRYLLVLLLLGCAQEPQRPLTPEERAAVLQYLSSRPGIQPYQGQVYQMPIQQTQPLQIRTTTCRRQFDQVVCTEQ
jgi:hypothetical protein